MRALYILPGIALVAALALSSVFIVDEREKALVLQFGQVKQVVDEPGLRFKIPLIQEVYRYDSRILGLPTQPLEVTPLDDRRLVQQLAHQAERDITAGHNGAEQGIHLGLVQP